jgi:hypothetical protein
MGLAVSLGVWLTAVAWVVRFRAALLERLTEQGDARAESFSRMSRSAQFRSIAIGDSAEGLAWLAAFGLIFFALDRSELSLWTEFGIAVSLAGLWTYGDYARSAALSSACGGASPYRGGAAVTPLWVAYWSTRLLMWLGFLVTACFAGRVFANLF